MLSNCLRSLALQMAASSVAVRQRLLKLRQYGVTFDLDNERSLWRKLFLSEIFETEFKTHYWVVDGLDKCRNIEPFLELMLPSIDPHVALRILLTIRETPALKVQFHALGQDSYAIERISEADTMPDIELLVRTRAKSIVAGPSDHHSHLIERILKRSRGSFLWTALVLKELS